jgi:chromatin remodeling complex protein RSC6
VNEVVPSTEPVEIPNVNDHVEIYAKMNQVISIVSSLKKEFKAMELKYARDLKVAQKQSSKKKKRTGTRNPSGFVKPTRISDELAAFLGKETGCEMARTAVTRELNNYIVLHSLKDVNNGRKINADFKLSTLLKLQEGEELTFFNLQKYMSPHFPKVVKPVVNVDAEQVEPSATSS